MSIPNTVVRLLTNVPFSISQDHVRDFTNVNTQTDYFTSKTKFTYAQFTYQREEQAIKVPENIENLYDIDYLMYQNKDYTNKWFYGFVTRKEYINPNTTAIYYELDVYQTWLFDMEIKPSYVIREHVNRWNQDGTPTIITLDEGLDYGTDYETVKVDRFRPFEDNYFLVVVTKNAMHYSGGTSYVNQVNPTINGLPQPLNYYVHPFKLDGGKPNVNVGGSTATLSSIIDVLKGLFTQEGAVNNVVSIYITDFFENVSYVKDTDTLSFGSGSYALASVSDDINVNINTIHVKELKTYRSTLGNFGSKYDGYHDVEESKLLMYPYTVLVLTDFKGNQVEIKNEYIGSDTLSIRVMGSLGPSNKVTYNIENYLIKDTLVTNLTLPLQHALINNNPNDLPILSDMLSAYLQGNRNQLENTKSSLMFNALTTTLGGAIGGGIGGGRLGILGAVGGATVGAINSYYQIESLNARQRDIENTPPQLANMGGNTSYDYGNDISGLYLVKKQITKEYRDRLTQYFKMFGYKVNELKVPNLKTREHFNFVHTTGVNISGNIPNNDLTRLKEIFNTGVTIWHGDFVGDYDKVNNEV